MAKLTTEDLVNLENQASAVTTINANNALIETAVENTLSRDGTSPNTMSADIDMNSNDLLNVGNVEAVDVTVGGVSLAASVVAAGDSATEASTSETNAATSETNAASSETNAAASAAVVADWEYAGNWATTTVYDINNIVYVSSEGGSYICLVDHTSDGSSFATDLGLGYWGVIAVKGAAGAGTGDMLKSENLSGLADYPTARSNMGLTIGANVEAYDATILKDADIGSTVEAYDATILKDADIGGSVQGYDADTPTVVVSQVDAEAGTATDARTWTAERVAQAIAALETGGSGAWALISSASITAVTNLDIAFDETTYIAYRIEVEDAGKTGSDASLQVRGLYNSAASVESGANYDTDRGFTNTSVSQSAWVLQTTNMSATAGRRLSGTVNVNDFGVAAGAMQIDFTVAHDTASSGVSAGAGGKGSLKGTDRVYDGVRLFWAAGDFIANGTVKVYGLKRA